VVTTGEPAGVGPDIALALLDGGDSRFAVIADPDLLGERALALGQEFDASRFAGENGRPALIEARAAAGVEPGTPDARNADYVLGQIRRAAEGCLSGEFSAMVTGPVNKRALCADGRIFTGHTEYLGDLAGAADTTMMFANSELRLGLATTHIGLAEVPGAIDASLVERKIVALWDAMTSLFGVDRPTIRVTGINPHAGEGGLFGDEERDAIVPAIEACRGRGLRVEGPVPADTAMIPDARGPSVAILSMYHDQCLPAAKALDFSGTVNVTLGLPFVRTSVDHGTAEPLAGTGRADPRNLFCAAELAADLATRRMS